MQFAAFVQQGIDGKPIMGLQMMDGDLIFQVALCTAENADEVVSSIITGLKQAKADLKRQASGLVIPAPSLNGLEVPDGFRSPQGRAKPGKSG